MSAISRCILSFVRNRLRTSALAAGGALCALLGAGNALAGGYYVGPIGSKAIGRGGAFTARADDLSAAFYNPAGFVRLGTTAVQLENKFSYTSFQFSRAPYTDPQTGMTTNFATVENSEKFQALDPLIGVSTNFGLQDWAFALVAYAGSGNSKLSFPVSGAQRYMMVNREATMLNYSLSAAFRPHPDFSIGVSAQVVAVPSLKYQLVVNGDFSGFLNNPVSNSPDMLATIEGKDLFTLNAIIGAQYRVSDAFELGLSGQVLPSEIRTNGPIKLEFLDLPAQQLNGITSQPVTYRNDEPANDVDLILPLPLTARLGGRYVSRRADKSELFDVELDVTYERLSRVERFSMNSRGLIAAVGANDIDVGSIRVEKHWRDTFGVALGSDFNVLQDFLTLRAGAYFETAAAEPAYTNVDFITGDQIGGTLGASLDLGGLKLNLAYEFRTQPEVSVGQNQGKVYQVVPLRPDAQTVVNAGAYRATTHSIGLGATYRF